MHRVMGGEGSLCMDERSCLLKGLQLFDSVRTRCGQIIACSLHVKDMYGTCKHCSVTCIQNVAMLNTMVRYMAKKCKRAW